MASAGKPGRRPAALAFFHRALAMAESLARAAELILWAGRALAVTGLVLPLIFAHRALAEAAIRARTAGLMVVLAGAATLSALCGRGSPGGGAGGASLLTAGTSAAVPPTISPQ